MRKAAPLLTLCVLLLGHPAAPAPAQRLAGQVVGVSDGDTITVLTPQKRPVRVRPHGVDCPESRQPFGQRARQFTSGLVFGRTVTVSVRDTDRYGRTVGDVFVPGAGVNRNATKREDEGGTLKRPAPLPNRPPDPTGTRPDLPRGVPPEAVPPPSQQGQNKPSGRNLNQELVRAGLAWWYRRYAPNDATLRLL